MIHTYVAGIDVSCYQSSNWQSLTCNYCIAHLCLLFTYNLIFMCIYYEVVTSLKSRLNEYANASAHISFLQKLFILQLKVLFMQGQIHTGKWIATVDAHNLIHLLKTCFWLILQDLCLKTAKSAMETQPVLCWNLENSVVLPH